MEKARARIWVTGVGLVTPLGGDAQTTWTRLVRGERAVRAVTLFDASEMRAGIAAEVDGVRVPEGGDWSRTSAMALSAAQEAMRAAGVQARRARMGLVVGGTTGGMFETEQLLARLHAEPDSREAMARMLSHPLTATGDRLGEHLGPFARVRTLSSACSSGANAIVVGATWLLAGEVDAVVAGGSDALCRLTLAGFNSLSAIDPEGCRPFDERRRGMSLGEGAGFLVLEREETARARGAKPVAELAGWALGSEAHHITNPEPGGTLVASLLARALSRAGLSPRDVDYVNAHGTGTPLNDPMEAAALARALSSEIARIPVSSSKAQIGHTLGAAGAIEAAITALVVARRTLVPTAGLDRPDDSLGLVHVPRVGREVGRVRAALSNAFGFGGMDTVLVLTPPPGPRPASMAGESLVASEATAVVSGAAVMGTCGLVVGEACAAIVDERHSRSVDPDEHLDLDRARRLDRAARLGAATVQAALGDAPREGTGVILGSAFGNVDGSAAFMHRIFEKGARFASPADFPNLVPSSPVGHVSIYLGLCGPAFATADLAASGESAVAQAVQFVRAGECDRIAAGSVEARSGIVERVLAALFAHAESSEVVPRVDLAAVAVVESEQAARARGAMPMARVRQVLEWRSDDREAIAALSAPADANAAEVVLSHASRAAGDWIARTPWSSCSRIACADALGESDGLGAAAIAVASARIATARTREALVLGLAKGRGYVIVLERHA